MNAYQILNVSPMATREELHKAYRELARRWHPDRFMEGPERDWATEKMSEINRAYKSCVDGTARNVSDESAEKDALKRARGMIDDGNYTNARKTLTKLNTRCAEWNFLFGTVLMRMADFEKALMYLSVATHQQPKNAEYARVLDEAKKAMKPKGIFRRF